MGSPKRAYLLIAGAVLLNGCAVASGFKIASLAANGLSYLVSGKSLSDHLISGAMGGDCALHRLIEGQAPCRATEQSSVAAAKSQQTIVQSSSSVTDVNPSWQKVDYLENNMTRVEADPGLDSGPQLYLVLGSYQALGNAEKHLAREEGAQLSPAVVNAKRHFRVVLGPLGASISTLVRSRTSRRNPGGWPVWLCPGTLRAPPCMTHVAQLPL